MSEKITINIPVTALVANLKFVHRIIERIEKATGEKIPALTTADMADIETKGLSVKTDLIHGMTMEIDVKLFSEVLDVYGDVAVAVIDAGIAVKNALEQAGEKVNDLQEEWLTEYPEETE